MSHSESEGRYQDDLERNSDISFKDKDEHEKEKLDAHKVEDVQNVETAEEVTVTTHNMNIEEKTVEDTTTHSKDKINAHLKEWKG
jgi:hypothetical protein